MSALPFLPGYTFTPRKKSYARSQKFAIRNGVPCHDLDHAQEVRSRGKPKKSLLVGNYRDDSKSSFIKIGQVVSSPTAKQQATSTTDSKQPAWLAYDNKALVFNAYFSQAIHSSALENFRIRKVKIFYHLRDGSISITEPRQDNAGIPQGKLLRRARIAKDADNFFGAEDFRLGSDITFHGRVYHIVDCDASTKRFYAENNMELGEAEDYPVDRFSVMQDEKKKRKNFGKQMHPMKTFMEARLGRAVGGNVRATQQFLLQSGNVLKFLAVWEDPSLNGEKRPYSIKYFLADDTVEVTEIQQANSGRDPFRAMLKRQKLPKNHRQVTANMTSFGRDDSKLDYYSEADFRIGAVINVFGRSLLLCDCNERTKAWYKKHYGLTNSDFQPIETGNAEPAHRAPQVPPYNGWGTEEDSLGSCKSLVPKAPRKNIKKMTEMAGKNLRFNARFANPTVENEGRQFVLTYFRADDTIGIFEKKIRNSGFIGGKFLERGRVKNRDTNQYMQPSEFFVGATVKIHGRKFLLEHADEYTFRHMEEYKQEFPKSDTSAIYGELATQGLTDDRVDALRAAFQEADTDGSGALDRQEFGSLLSREGYNLSEHELITLQRRYDTNGDGKIDFNEFVSALVQ